MRPLEQETSIETLRQAALILDAENQNLVQKVVEQQKELLRLQGKDASELQQRIARIEEQLARQLWMRFGNKSAQRPTPELMKQPQSMNLAKLTDFSASSRVVKSTRDAKLCG